MRNLITGRFLSLPKVFRDCLVCKKEFIIAGPAMARRIHTTKFCSQKCHYKYGHTIEAKKKIRIGTAGIWLGRKHSEETKKKISMFYKKKFSDPTKNPNWKGGKSKCLKCGKQLVAYGVKLCRMHALHEVFSNKQRITSIEKKVYEELKIRGLLFEKQKVINGKFLVDAYIPKLNLVIECDGDYWHSLDRVKKKDKAENAYLTKCGFNLLRLSEKEINNGSYKERLVS